jgi:hypothetical protein
MLFFYWSSENIRFVSIYFFLFEANAQHTFFKLVSIFETSGFWPRMRARALRAPVFLSSLPPQTGRCAPPPAHRSFAASYSTPKNIYNLSNLGRPHQELFSFHWTTEAMKNEDPCPSKLYTDATIRPNFFGLLFFL